MNSYVPKCADTAAARPALFDSDEPHAENKRLYAIDETVFGVDEAPELWQFRHTGKTNLPWWQAIVEPAWAKTCEYRRDSSAPPQPSMDWLDAPECANYRTVDGRAHREWWTRKPTKGVISWFAEEDPVYGVGERLKTGLHEDWKNSLEFRPPEAWFELMRGEPKADADGWIGWPGGDTQDDSGSDSHNDGPAFPAEGPSASQFENTGMSLRDWFAGQALVGLLAGRHGDQFGDDWDVGMDAYGHADAVLAERAKGGES